MSAPMTALTHAELQSEADAAHKHLLSVGQIDAARVLMELANRLLRLTPVTPKETACT